MGLLCFGTAVATTDPDLVPIQRALYDSQDAFFLNMTTDRLCDPLYAARFSPLKNRNALFGEYADMRAIRGSVANERA